MKTPRTLVLDSGALIDLERNPRGRVGRACDRAVEDGAQILLPTVVWAQVYRHDARQIPLDRAKKTFDTVAFTDETAVEVGRLLAHSRTDDIVDAAVVVEALKQTSIVLTSDPSDIRHLAESVGMRLEVVAL
jgi:hypothetical protein